MHINTIEEHTLLSKVMHCNISKSVPVKESKDYVHHFHKRTLCNNRKYIYNSLIVDEEIY